MDDYVFACGLSFGCNNEDLEKCRDCSFAIYASEAYASVVKDDE